MPRIDPEALRQVAETFERASRLTAGQQEALERTAKVIPTLSASQADSLARALQPTLDLFRTHLLSELPRVPNAEQAREMLEQLRSSPELDIGLDRRQALSLGASAEDAAGALTEDEREEFEEASYDLREFLDEMEPWERRAMLERLGTAILATLSYIERLASQGSAAGGSIALFAAVWSLYLLYALVDRTITAVEERREEDDS